MNCMDLFVAAVAIGLGFETGKGFFSLFFSWSGSFWENWKRPSYILEGVVLFLAYFYLVLCKT